MTTSLADRIFGSVTSVEPETYEDRLSAAETTTRAACEAALQDIELSQAEAESIQAAVQADIARLVELEATLGRELVDFREKAGVMRSLLGKNL